MDIVWVVVALMDAVILAGVLLIILNRIADACLCFGDDLAHKYRQRGYSEVVVFTTTYIPLVVVFSCVTCGIVFSFDWANKILLDVFLQDEVLKEKIVSIFRILGITAMLVFIVNRILKHQVK